MKLSQDERAELLAQDNRILPFLKAAFRASIAKAEAAAAAGDSAAADDYLQVAQAMSDALSGTNRTLLWQSLGNGLAGVVTKTRFEITQDAGG